MVFLKCKIIVVILIFLLFPGQDELLYAENPNNHRLPYNKDIQNQIQNFIGNQDGVIVVDPKDRICLSKNADNALIPASTLKILTALAAFHYLDTDFRFITEFYLDDQSNLKIKGYGDPLLISEIIVDIAGNISDKSGITTRTINDLVLDDTYFKHPLIVPGIGSSLEPYDAPNGALCVNFNTVYFSSSNDGTYTSAESQTPLLPFALKKITASGLKKGRIIFSDKGKEHTMYAGYLFKYFLEKKGITIRGHVKTGTVDKAKDQRIFRYVSGFSLEEVTTKLLEHSNNFVSNQMLITIGAKMYGYPGTLANGVRTLSTYVNDILKINDIRIVEGSGISRENRISVRNFAKILDVFEPYYGLLRQKNGEFYKTGTLKGISTRAGYIKNSRGELYRYVLFINTPGKQAETIMNALHLTTQNN